SNILKWVWGLNKRYLLLAGFYIVLFLSIGDRGGPLSLILTFLVLTGALVRPFKLKELLVIIFIGALLMTIIGLGRSVKSNKGILAAGYEQLDLGSTYIPTLEL